MSQFDKPRLEDFYDTSDPRGCSTSEYDQYVKAVIKWEVDHKNSWVSWEYYLLVLGARSLDSAYTLPEIYSNIEYFKNCWQNHISQYKALEFFSFELDEKTN